MQRKARLKLKRIEEESFGGYMDCESDDSDYEERDRALTMCTFTTASPKKKSLTKQ